MPSVDALLLLAVVAACGLAALLELRREATAWREWARIEGEAGARLVAEAYRDCADRLQARSLAELQAVRNPEPVPAPAAEEFDADWAAPSFQRPDRGREAEE